ncbi:hypothetical protein ACWGE1_19755 [Streptomyces sp. NPDC054932]
MSERIHPALRADPTMSVPKWSNPDETEPDGRPRRAFTTTGTGFGRLKVTVARNPTAGRS